MIAVAEPLRCPVCRARFRGQVRCSRCGADLADLMRLMLRAHGLRADAAHAIGAGRFGQACDAAGASLAMHATLQARRLHCVARFLQASDTTTRVARVIDELL